MKLDEYQEAIVKFDTFEQTGDLAAPAYLEKVLGLAGEAGEATDKYKKILRDKGGAIDATDRTEIAKELGDVLWYVATLARYLEMPLSEVAQGSIDKLQSRLERGKLHGAGDNR